MQTCAILCNMSGLGVTTGAMSQDISEPLHIIAVLRLILPERERRRSSQKSRRQVCIKLLNRGAIAA
eukprot:scaffold167_cov86-Skeletonema_marinoi.AAC.1